MPSNFYPFVDATGETGVEKRANEDPSGETGVGTVRYPARIAVYDDHLSTPRVVVVEAKDVRSYLEEVTDTVSRLAKEQGGLIQEKQVRDAFADMHFEDDQMKLVFDYLAGQNIGIGEPLNPEDYLSQEEINYLDSYLESLTGLDELSSGEKEAVTLSAMAGDVDARRRLTEIFLPQVVDIAKLYAGQGALLEDLIGEGNVALAMAVEMLETAGNASEAEGLIGSMIMEAMVNHISENVQQKETGQKIADKVNQVADQARELAESLGRKVTLAELADETGMSLFDLKEAVDLSGDAIEDIDSKGEN